MFCFSFLFLVLLVPSASGETASLWIHKRLAGPQLCFSKQANVGSVTEMTYTLEVLLHLSEQLNKMPHPCIFERLGCERLFLKPRRFTFINISAFYELLGYCHRRPFLLHGIFIGVGTQGHLVSAPASPLTCLSRSPGTS